MVVVSVKGLDLWYTNSIVEPSSVKWPDGEQATTTLIDPAVRSQHTDADFQFFIPQDMTGLMQTNEYETGFGWAVKHIIQFSKCYESTRLHSKHRGNVLQ